MRPVWGGKFKSEPSGVFDASRQRLSKISVRADFDIVPTPQRAPNRAFLLRACDRATARRGFRRLDFAHGVPLEFHRLCFRTAGMVSHTTLGVFYGGGAVEPIVDRIAPDFGMGGLIPKLRQYVVVALI